MCAAALYWSHYWLSKQTEPTQTYTDGDRQAVLTDLTDCLRLSVANSKRLWAEQVDLPLIRSLKTMGVDW